MLAGVLFDRADHGTINPKFVAQFVLTDLFLSSVSTRSLRHPILPSIATLVNPLSSLLTIMLGIMRAVLLVILSHLPGSPQAIKKISVANTAILYHDGRALATCESGPPMRILLPTLGTVGWFNGSTAEGEPGRNSQEVGFGGTGLLSFMKEWTTGHPKVDPDTKEMILYHCTFAPPYVHYSVLQAEKEASNTRPHLPKLINIPVPGVSGGKMMHDFGVSRNHTIIMDLPLTLDPLNLVKNKPIVSYDPSGPSRFGIFPRRDPSRVHWFETSACCIFHTANAWDTEDKAGNITSVNLLACRLTSATMVYNAGNIAVLQVKKKSARASDRPTSFFDKENLDSSDTAPADLLYPESGSFDAAPSLESLHQETSHLITIDPKPDTNEEALSSDEDEEEQCRLYYYSFTLPTSSPPQITTQHALSAIPFEFPTLNPAYATRSARYIYGCSTSTSTTFSAALGRTTRIDVLAKIDAHALIARGQQQHPAPPPVSGCVDTRTVPEILALDDPDDPIRCFRMPRGWCAQEARFVARRNPVAEDDGYLLFYAFDEAQLGPDGEAGASAVSELWVLEARGMREVVARVRLPQRVPYGLHGEWFGEGEIEGQRPVEGVREVLGGEVREGGWGWGKWMGVRGVVEEWLG